MAVAAEPLLKSSPDVAKLNTFSGVTVTVTKHAGAKGTPGGLVVPTQRMTKENLLDLPKFMPSKHGPGWYRFTAVDTGGTGEDAWMVRLGEEVQAQETQAVPSEVYHMGTTQQPNQFAPQLPSTAPPTGEDVTNLGNGYYYNMALSTLTTPWRQIYSWRLGEEFPKPPSAATPASTGLQMPPWAAHGQQGWGGFPVGVDSSTESSKVRALETQIAEQRREREMDGLRAEIRRQQEATEKALSAIVEKLSAKPSGPSDEVQLLRAELAEQKRRQEDRDREERTRSEIASVKEQTAELVRRMTDNKPDPMLPMLMQILQSSQSAATESVKSIQAATAATASASERSLQTMLTQLSGQAVTPMQLVQLMANARGDASEMSKTLLDSAKESMAMQREVFGQLLEVSSQGGQPPWVSIAQQALEKVSAVGVALAERQAAAANAQQQPQMRPQVQQIRRQPAVTGASGGAPAGLPAVADIRQVPERLRPDLSPSELARERAAAGIEHFSRASTPVDPTPPANMNGASHHAPLQEFGDVEVIPPPKRKRGRPPKAKPPAAPQKDPAGYTLEEMREQDPEEVREAVAPFSDEVFFGPIMPYVVQLRQSLEPAEKIAEQILSARSYVQGFGVTPMAMELLLAGQIEVLVDRLLPDADDDRRAAIVDEISGVLEAEESGAAAQGDGEEADA